jgi:hypothetical protein
MNLGLNVDLSGQPVDLKLSDLPVKLGDDGSLQVLGLAIPLASRCRRRHCSRCATWASVSWQLNASTEAINIAVDGRALPRIRFAPGVWRPWPASSARKAGCPPALLDAGINTLLKDGGITTRIALSGEVDQSAAPAEVQPSPRPNWATWRRL